uniref:Integrase, catalytic region, zinc finger, CCHC-type, peptidase aspartic, catalytic n=1 Tax=Tanacetum cinerariifolium TaxID=118510 RepID=A0A6L2K746_TANCI|nr:integrase, catalytic region, zinc finger, CCHC-type, peptidase aspartic, catalytic [Tanacetum cinerariifolium]
MLLMQAQENRVALDEEQLLFIAGGKDNVDDDVDEQSLQDLALNTMFMENLSSAYSVYDEASSSYDSDIVSEVYDHDNYQDAVCELHEVHEMHDHVQPHCVVNSNADYTSDSNTIPYDEYVNDNTESIVQNTDIVKSKHAHVLVHDSEDTLEIVETTRKQMNEKIKDPECVKKKVKITPHDYSKENYLATFTPQKQLTPEQIFRSKDLINTKAEALKEKTPALRPIKAFTVNNREVHLDYLKHLKESVATLREIVEEAQAKTNVFVIPSTRVNSGTDASGSKPSSNNKKNRILPAKSVNKKKVEEHPRTNKSSFNCTNCVDSSISSTCTVINLNSSSVFKTCNNCLTFANHDMCVVNYLHSVNASPSIKNGGTKHMTGDRSQLRNFIKKFIGTVRFENDHFGAIMGYEDYVIGDCVISRVYYVEGLGHNLFSVRQFHESDLEVAFRKHSCYVSNTDGVELIKGSRGSNLYTISIEDILKKYLERGLPRLKFEKDHLCSACQLGKSKNIPTKLKAEAVTTACYTQNRSLIHTRQNKSPYELVHDKKPDLTFLRVFDALCYPTNDSEDLVKLQSTADIGIFVGYAPNWKGLAPSFLRPGQISSGLVLNLVPTTPYVPGSIN